MKPFEPGDKVVIKTDILSHSLKDVVCTVITCYQLYMNIDYVVTIDYDNFLYYADNFMKINNRKHRINRLYENK